MFMYNDGKARQYLRIMAFNLSLAFAVAYKDNIRDGSHWV